MKKNIFILFLLLNNGNSHAIDDNVIYYTLAHKIILCTGPSYGRKQLLLENTRRDMVLIPFKKIFVATNDQNNMDVQFDDTNTVCQLFKIRGKQLDCLNCIILSVKMAIADPEVLDDDIILFKHESVFISDMNLVRKAIATLLNGYEFVCKYWIGSSVEKDGLRLNNYYHTDSFFITARAARKVFSNQKEVTCFTSDYQFCEEYFTKYIVSTLSKIYKIDYHHSSWKDNELGLYHMPRYEEDLNWYWDKKNYDDLYK